MIPIEALIAVAEDRGLTATDSQVMALLIPDLSVCPEGGADACERVR